jgi:ferrous iron transport protein B
MKKIRVAIAGNPNSGKTTVFNNVTGGRQHVGNYPGVTVEKKTGSRKHDGHEIEIVDLPGTYNLTTWSLDEKVARDFIINERPDVVVDVVDSSNLERHLYLTTQLVELGLPIVLVFNMSDVAEAHGIEFDTDMLSAHFGAPIVKLVASKDKGTDLLLDAIVEVFAEKSSRAAVAVTHVHEIEDEISRIEKCLIDDEGVKQEFSELFKTTIGSRWIATKLLEGDRDVREHVTSDVLGRVIDESSEKLRDIFGDSPAMLIADKRYGYISGACQEAVKNTAEIRHTSSDMADTIITHRFWGVPIFLLLMYVVFNITFKLGEPLMALLEMLIASIGGLIESLWPDGHMLAVKSMIIDGVIGGVGGVIVFLPNIMLLFAAIAILEYSGYMARAAFVMDRLMHKIGLHGKSFIPMLVGFGCSVPAIMATRTLDNRRDRLVTMLIIPLMSCGARFPIYMLIIPAFFPKSLYTPMLWLIYVIGIALAIACAKLLGMFVFKEKTEGLVMELPPYRVPTIKCIWIHMWERACLYIKKAGTVILLISILMWVLTNYPKQKDVDSSLSPSEQRSEQLSHSVAGRIGHAIEPVMTPLGFDWKIGTALIGAFAAKEVFVSQMGVVYAVGSDDEQSSLRTILSNTYSPLTGFCIMLFCLIGFPCMATCAAVKMESGAWKWAYFQFAGLTTLAYIVTLTVYQVGTLVGL